jgi:apolipoprotein D and lipocalin family protein
MALRTTLLLSCMTLALLGCAGNDHPAPPRTQQVDLQRYQGTGMNWRDCRCSSSVTA